MVISLGYNKILNEYIYNRMVMRGGYTYIPVVMFTLSISAYPHGPSVYNNVDGILYHTGTHFWEPLGRQHVAPTVRDLLRLRGMDAWGPQRGGHIGAMSHALTIADGLIDTLDKRHVAIEFLEVITAQSLS